ncbi:hypothetical protein CEXT_247761 [Caerostris extrusa]|uniref:Uncharacterized protein n=1 Tax=Caerostris extrusa TaxID=172846 RepID=A0AAV4MNW5_CAEEX|nr:hypothetical protein CEXT_247761 [Caerostris extrusa]
MKKVGFFLIALLVAAASSFCLGADLPNFGHLGKRYQSAIFGVVIAHQRMKKILQGLSLIGEECFSSWWTMKNSRLGS